MIKLKNYYATRFTSGSPGGVRVTLGAANNIGNTYSKFINRNDIKKQIFLMIHLCDRFSR